MEKEGGTYSPLPWRVVRTNSDLYIYSAYSKLEKKRFPYSNGRIIAKVADYTGFSQGKNAKLIAAAPELLIAAKLAFAYLNRKGPDDAASVEHKLKHILSKVIAKAEEHEADTTEMGEYRCSTRHK
ncbi:hypothetical protein [Bacillus swezeyi]|uniref:Phage portal protein n=1 Tax=Bacillus swezeyi TaxID=1925020 RepID=A0A5M8RZR6_9BACI|nr:hypothetical protein [Bacillus swezeyi]KAA6453221.1 hypothetical protein DX927_03170 [Bacillus swezeyi]TYS38591.1 hypothetical protein FZC77_03060 [Bacillus swezeyi]